MPPTSSEIGQIIRLPTRAAGLRFEEDPASSVRLDDMLRDAAAEHPEVLPLLQFTLEELYQRRTDDGTLTLEAYRELGGVEGSLAQRAETVFKDMPDDVEEQLPKVLNALVSIEHDGHETIGRKRAPWSDEVTGKIHEFFETFVENRLFVTELADDGSAVVTVAHEALLWHWPRVREWVDQNRENLRIRGRISAAADRWLNERKRADLLLPRGKPLGEAESLIEHEIELNEIEAAFIAASVSKAKRIQLIKAGVVASLAVLGLVAATSAYIANQQRTEAIQQRARAEVEAETAKQTTDFMVGLFGVSDPSEARGNTITAREIMDRGAAKIEEELTAQPVIQATLMETMGTVYTSLGLYNQATELLERALEIRHQTSTDNVLEVADTKNRLGEVLSLNADYETAELMYRDALTARRESLGDEHLLVADSLRGLAYVLKMRGNYKGAESLLREALGTRQKLLGEINPDVAQTLEELGLNLFDQGDYDGAEPLLRESVQMRRHIFGDDPYPGLAEGINNLGLLLWSKGDYREAEELFREALEMKQELFGNTHPEIAVGLNNLALVLHDQKKYTDAETMFRQVIAMQRQLLGDNHPEVATGLYNLSFVLVDIGETDAAIAMARQSLDIYRRTFGNEHPDIARVLTSLGESLTRQGHYAEAEPMLRESLEMRRRLEGDEHPAVAASLTALAQLMVATGVYEDGHLLAQQARQIFSTALSESHWRTGVASSVEGASLTGLRRFDEAEALLTASYALLDTDAGVLEIYKRDVLRHLVRLYLAWGKPQQATRYQQLLDKSISG
jgi:tetratricopeptide (TPR) repeat protein